jgi:succinoglycan biosynthesis transport protein ExoP
MELRQYAGVVWKWMWLIVLSTAVAGVSSWLTVKDQAPTYQTSTTLMIGTAIQKQDPNYQDFYTSEQLAQTYSELIKREPILRATARALGFEEQWPALRGQVAVSLVPGTQLMEIRVVDTNAERAAAVANEVAQQLILQSPSAPRPEEAQRRAFVQQQLDDLETDIDATKDEITRLQGSLGEMFSAREIADTQNQIAALQQKLRELQANYGQLMAVQGEGSTNTLTVVEPAAVPRAPIGSNQMMTVATAAAIGLALALGAAFLIEYLDDTVKTPEDVSKAMDLTMLAGISRIPGEAAQEKLITIKHPKAPISEAYRVLRTNLQFSSLDQPLRTLVVTSPNPVEGKSTTVANLGVVMAQAGKRVVLVDADLRRPVLHRIFGVENKEGLTDVLLNEEPVLDGHLQATGVDNLRLLNTGPLPPNPSELLGSQRMAALIEQLKGEADVILFDSPPSLAVTDASVLATQADGVLMVADAGRTRRKFAAEAVERFQQVGANLLGVVLNRLKPGRGGYYYYYYHYYYGNGRKPRRGLARLLRRRKR